MKKGFTLAEVLITLAIIGVVASLTITSVISDYKKTEAVSRLKKAYSDISRILYQAAYYSGVPLNADSLKTMNAREMFDRYWGPYLRNSKLCRMPVDCGYKNLISAARPWKMLNGSLFQYDPPSGGSLTDVKTDDNSRMLFLYGSGVVVFYPMAITATNDPNFTDDKRINIFLIDINGSKPPNTLGYDVFMFEIDKSSKVQPFTGDDSEREKYRDDCIKGGQGLTCTQKIIKDGWAIKGDYPW